VEGAPHGGYLPIDVGGTAIVLTPEGILRKRGIVRGTGSVRDRVTHLEGVDKTSFPGALPGEPSIVALPGPDGAGRALLLLNRGAVNVGRGSVEVGATPSSVALPERAAHSEVLFSQGSRAYGRAAKRGSRVARRVLVKSVGCRRR